MRSVELSQCLFHSNAKYQSCNLVVSRSHTLLSDGTGRQGASVCIARVSKRPAMCNKCLLSLG